MNQSTVLIVDDEPQIRRVLSTMLTSHGYPVIEARSGDEALDKIRHEKVELILLDVNMPGRSGIETCAEIRRSGDVPVIMLTVRSADRSSSCARMPSSTS